MPLRTLYNQSTATLNPSYLTGTLPGGAGAITTGTSTSPGISAPFVEQVVREVFDITAPTNIANSAPPTPAPVGKLIVWDPYNTAFGAGWKLNSVKNQAIPRDQYGVVYSQGSIPTGTTCVATSNGNISQQGVKSLVVVEGPAQAYVTTIVNTTAISAGMALAADGAGNLTYAGASPAVGTVLAIAAGNVAASVSTPTLTNVYLGGY